MNIKLFYLLMMLIIFWTVNLVVIIPPAICTIGIMVLFMSLYYDQTDWSDWF